MMKARFVLVSVMALAAAGVARSQELQTPSDWKFLTDAPARLVQGQDVRPDAFRFVSMPPGWHVTTGPGAILFQPEYAGRGNFSVEAEIFLFPGESQEEYGIFVGGRNLEPSVPPNYIAFVVRRDGRASVIRQGGMSPIIDWKSNDAVVPHTGEGTAKNILRVDANPTDVVFSANGKEIVRLPRSGLALDGQFGFRIGSQINIHASRLDITYRLAPVPGK